MKRILSAVMAAALLLCLIGCTEQTDNPPTSTVTTTLSAADSNRAALAKLGFEEIMNYLNICAAYNVPVEVKADDTIDDIVARLREDGSDIPVHNILGTKKFFDYAEENPDVENGTGVYIARENADWLALYTD